ncbi:MAG: hydroxymethylbilane synthase [bacterium]
MRVRLGTRGSALARIQADLVADALRRHHPGMTLEVVVIATTGDGRRPAEAGDAESAKGLFTKEIEERLLAGEIDLAVHSLKDLPVEETAGLRIAATPARADPRDALVSRLGGLIALPPGARVGTGSLRRELLVREVRPDLTIVPARGNVETRLRKLAAGEMDALVLAAAGLIRLGRESVITEWLPPEVFVPAPGQGALAVQLRSDDAVTAALTAGIDHAATRLAVRAERRFAAHVGGGCRLPVGAYGSVRDGRLALTGMVAGPRPVRVTVEGAVDEGERLAAEAALTVRAAGVDG